ncbi:MAG: hypothetical protein ABW061_04890 [Polyangiaceae bacterium]
MHWNKWSLWLALAGIAVGCNAKLSVDPGPDGSAGKTAVAGHEDTNEAGSPDTAGAGAGGHAQTNGGGSGGIFVGHAGSPVQGGAPNGGAGDNGAGSGGAAPARGELGQKCIPGATADSGDGIGKTQVTTLAHCNPGLACNSAGKCAALPACPAGTGECVVANVTGTGGTSGLGTAGAAGYSTNVGGANPGTVVDETGVSDLAADDTNLYWLAYGTRDSLGNHHSDGALQSLKRADLTTTKLASGLAGPTTLALTAAHAYVLIDGGGIVGTPVHRTLLRFPLGGGAAETIQIGTPPLIGTPDQFFVSVAGTLYWTGTDQVFSLADDSTVPSVFSTTPIKPLDADSTNLYFSDDNGIVTAAPLAGGTVQTLGFEWRWAFAVNGDNAYSIELADQDMILSKAAKVNGSSWLRTRALGTGYPRRLSFVGDRFFIQWSKDVPAATCCNSREGISTGLLGSTAPLVELLDLPQGTVTHWVGTSDSVYWTDGTRIFARAIPTP